MKRPKTWHVQVVHHFSIRTYMYTNTWTSSCNILQRCSVHVPLARINLPHIRNIRTKGPSSQPNSQSTATKLLAGEKGAQFIGAVANKNTQDLASIKLTARKCLLIHSQTYRLISWNRASSVSSFFLSLLLIYL